MQDVLFKLGYFEVTNAAYSWQDLASEATTHYTSQIIKQAKLIFISIQISINFDDQFFLIYLRTKLLRINLKVEHCEALYAPSNDI
jgi:hypothetical protein